MSTDLAEFLSARLDEDVMVAGEAITATEEHEGSFWSGVFGAYNEGFLGKAEAEYIARHEPVRAVREVEADRALLAAYLNPDPLEGPEYAAGIRLALMLRAGIWRDHPDYDPNWALAGLPPQARA